MVPAIEQARAAAARCRWGDAWRLLPACGGEQLDADDLDVFATAGYLTGHDSEAFELWTRAHRQSLEAGALRRAVYFALRLGQGLGFKGDLARCRGWMDRTAHLLPPTPEPVAEQGYVEMGLGMLRLFEAGDLPAAHGHFVRAREIGSACGDRELTTVAAIREGRLRIYLGDLDGMALLDEAMASLEAGELTPLFTGDSYCTVIDACAELFDVARCRAWTTSFVRWCDTQQELVIYRGHCFLHRAEMLALHGEWGPALDEARRANSRLAAPLLPAALAGSAAIEGDVLRLAGAHAAAEAAYRRAVELGCDPQPGLALLRRDQGRGADAVAIIQRALAEAQGPIARSRLLDAGVAIHLADGDTANAARAANELDTAAVTLGTPLLRARAAAASGAVLLAGGDATAALVALRRAFATLNELGIRYEAAVVRRHIAEGCRALGDDDTARAELSAAEATLAALRDTVTMAPAGMSRADRYGLTDRELQVLRLVAAGRTNRMIADELVVSEKTVASHVSHIFTKLAVTSRSAATAFAYDHDLV